MVRDIFRARKIHAIEDIPELHDADLAEHRHLTVKAILAAADTAPSYDGYKRLLTPEQHDYIGSLLTAWDKTDKSFIGPEPVSRFAARERQLRIDDLRTMDSELGELVLHNYTVLSPDTRWELSQGPRIWRGHAKEHPLPLRGSSFQEAIDLVAQRDFMTASLTLESMAVHGMFLEEDATRKAVTQLRAA